METILFRILSPLQRSPLVWWLNDDVSRLRLQLINSSFMKFWQITRVLSSLLLYHTVTNPLFSSMRAYCLIKVQKSVDLKHPWLHIHSADSWNNHRFILGADILVLCYNYYALQIGVNKKVLFALIVAISTRNTTSLSSKFFYALIRLCTKANIYGRVRRTARAGKVHVHPSLRPAASHSNDRWKTLIDVRCVNQLCGL